MKKIGIILVLLVTLIERVFSDLGDIRIHYDITGKG